MVPLFKSVITLTLFIDIILIVSFSADGSLYRRRGKADPAWIETTLCQAEGQREEQEVV